MLRALLGKLETYFLAVKLLEAMFSFYAINSLGFVTSVVSALYVLAISMPCKKRLVSSHHQSGESSHLWLVSVGDDVN